ncbi:hypothetical protein GWI33_003855, partial [Rhynchophorus ferrugineus]
LQQKQSILPGGASYHLGRLLRLFAHEANMQNTTAMVPGLGQSPAPPAPPQPKTSAPPCPVPF